MPPDPTDPDRDASRDDDPFADPSELAAEAARVIAHRTGVARHDVAVVLGSGWAGAAAALGTPVAEVSFNDLPGFNGTSVSGHDGRVLSVRVGDRSVLVFLGRTHLYEGLGPAAVVHYVRTAHAAGCSTLVATNGCGGLKAHWAPGTVVLIRDHINLTGATPLVGATFVDLVDAYSPALRAMARRVEPRLEEGVYVQRRGSEYETPAEIGMLRVLGGDLVGMSTALEVIAARECGMQVLGLSLVTNLAAGMTGGAISHDEVLQSGREAAARVGQLLARLLPEL